MLIVNKFHLRNLTVSHPERYFGYSRKDIRKRATVSVLNLRSVENHSDKDYRKAVASVLSDKVPRPLIAVIDEVAKKLPRLESTGIEEYYLVGTYVDRVRLSRVLDELVSEKLILKTSNLDSGITVESFLMEQEDV